MLAKLLLGALVSVGAILPAVTPPKPKPLKAPVDERALVVMEASAVGTTADRIDWSVKAVNAPAAWERGWAGKGVAVAVLDTGVMAAHRDLRDAVKGRKSFVGGDGLDAHGHGTHCAGAIGARRNDWGTVGVAPECDLYCGQVLDASGRGDYGSVKAGVLWAVREVKADVVSMSIGGQAGDAALREAINEAADAGVIVVCAAGNDTLDNPVNYPAAYLGALAVSAVDRDDKVAEFSCSGGKIEVAAPGVATTAPWIGGEEGKFAEASGTSMATPVVAGVAALWVQADAKAGGAKATRPKRFRDWLAANARDLGISGRDDLYGWGMPDAGKIK